MVKKSRIKRTLKVLGFIAGAPVGFAAIVVFIEGCLRVTSIAMRLIWGM